MAYKRPLPTEKISLEEATLHYLKSVMRQHRNAVEKGCLSTAEVNVVSSTGDRIDPVRKNDKMKMG